MPETAPRTETEQRQGYPSVDGIPLSLDSLPDGDPVREFVLRVRGEIKDCVPELYLRDDLLPEGGRSLSSSAPDLTNDHLPPELAAYAGDLEGVDLDLTDLVLLEDFHQARTTWLKLGRGSGAATALALEGMSMGISRTAEDTGEAARQIELLREFAACYDDPTTAA